VNRVPIEIVTCPQWGAAPPRQGLVAVPAAARIIDHHTAGHHREIENPANESRAETVRYARDIQRAHMAPGGLGVPSGGIDSGHNFLVCRNGDILQGRWLSVATIEAGHMVHSAHCPSQNGQIGIEHEHNGSELMTAAQRESSARLRAWIASCYRRRTVLLSAPHRRFFNTQCPGVIGAQMAGVNRRAQQILDGEWL
jgi:hypothetical protein